MTIDNMLWGQWGLQWYCLYHPHHTPTLTPPNLFLHWMTPSWHSLTDPDTHWPTPTPWHPDDLPPIHLHCVLFLCNHWNSLIRTHMQHLQVAHMSPDPLGVAPMIPLAHCMCCAPGAMTSPLLSWYLIPPNIPPTPPVRSWLKAWTPDSGPESLFHLEWCKATRALLRPPTGLSHLVEPPLRSSVIFWIWLSGSLRLSY